MEWSMQLSARVRVGAAEGLSVPLVGASVGKCVGSKLGCRVGYIVGRKGLVVGTEVGTAVTTNDVFALQGAPAPLATVPLDVLIRQLTSERYVPPHVYGLKVFPM